MPDCLDYLPDVKAGADESSAPASCTVTKDDQRVLVAPQPFIDIPLGESGHCRTSLTRMALQRLKNSGGEAERCMLLRFGPLDWHSSSSSFVTHCITPSHTVLQRHTA